jgi:hypothetical protein
VGHTITEWRTRVAVILRDGSNQDLSSSQLVDVCIGPALAQYSIDRPYVKVAEAAGTGGDYPGLPSRLLGGVRLVEWVQPHPGHRAPGP